jgi:hypothetical protein
VKNYYAILGLSQSATAADIKKAYREGCKKYHPDKNAHPDAHFLFLEIHEAYEFLCDDENRRLYHLFIAKSHQNQRVREWQDQKRKEAQRRAVEFAKQEFEDFKKSKYYRLASQVNLGYNLLFIALCLLVVVVPLYQYIQQQELPDSEQKPFLAFLVPMALGFSMGVYAFHSWFIEKRDIFK